jgi:uncharacterized protein (DUF2342 family)
VNHIGACKTVDQKRHLGYNSYIQLEKGVEMTRKHFIAMAKEIAQMTDRKSARIAAEAFAQVARGVNSRFDTNRFLTACGV